jgi:DNA-binding NarL/FixJ family response regulator
VEAAKQAVLEAERFHLEFVRPHTLVSETAAYIGLREFDQAEARLREIETAAQRMADPYLVANADILRCRLLLSEGSPDQALQAAAGDWSRGPTPARKMEFAVTRAAALACAGDPKGALEMLEEVDGGSRWLEPRLLHKWTTAVSLLFLESDVAEDAVVSAYEATVASRGYDAFVFANRLHPSILPLLAKDQRHRHSLALVLARSNDHQPALTHGLSVSREGPEEPPLTPRERDVYSLLAEGRSNREIARALFISEPTVKVHVRSILRKLGARSRVEAAIQAARTRRPQAGAAEGRVEDPRGFDPQE